jgi:intracellular multiplication protein IcmP
MAGPKSVVDEQPIIAFVILLVAMAGLGWFAWRMHEVQILNLVRYVRLGELYVMNILTLGDYQQLIDRINPSDRAASNFTRTDFAMTTAAVNNFFRWPAAIGMVVWGIYAMFFTTRAKFKNQYSLEQLIKVQSKIWPIITPIVKFNPIKEKARANGDTVPDQLPPFAEALSPEEWISYHSIPIISGLPERDAVRRALTLQLGPRWTGVANLPPYIRALFAAFALKGVQKRADSDSLLGEISLCWSPSDGFSMSLSLKGKIDAIIADKDIGGKAAEIAKNYAWRTTALLGVLRWGRMMGGVLAPAAFLWLRAEDRMLWYPLNNLGRRSYHAEAAGVMAHFMAEQAAKKPLPIPRVETALITINQYLANNQVAIPPSENSSKRA